MPDSYPRDGIFNPHLTTIEDHYIIVYQKGIYMGRIGVRTVILQGCSRWASGKLINSHVLAIWHHLLPSFYSKKSFCCDFKPLTERAKHQFLSAKCHNGPKFSDRQVLGNSVDPDKTVPRGAVRSGSTLFAIPSTAFGPITLWKGHLVEHLGWLPQNFWVSEFLGVLR